MPCLEDHHGGGGAAVTGCRNWQFEGVGSVRDVEGLDPGAASTFEAAKLNWAEPQECEHARTLALYRALLHLRKTDPVLQNRERRHLTAGSVGDSLLWVSTVTGDGAGAGECVLLWNTGSGEVKLDTLPLPFPLPPREVLHSENRAGVTKLLPGEALLLGSPA